MSLTVNEGAASAIPLLPEDVYPAVCSMLVDLGDQYSEKFGKTSRKVLIGWELPTEKLDNGEPRRLSNTYTASLNAKGNLRKDLISWRGRDFTPDELKAFDLRNIVGVPCMISVIHKLGQDGQKRAVIGGVMKLPKGMVPSAPSVEPTIFDLDAPDAAARLGELPEWIQTRVKESETWKAMTDEAQYARVEERGKRAEESTPDPAAVAQISEALAEEDDDALPF